MSDCKFYRNFPPWLYELLDEMKFRHEIAIVLKISTNRGEDGTQVWETVINRDVTNNEALRKQIKKIYGELVELGKEKATKEMLFS